MNTFGHAFRVTTFGESHGRAIGAVVDGCPPGLELTTEDIQLELDRRRPGQSAVTTARSESDAIELLSGVYQDRTTGTPIALVARNRDARPQDYDEIAKTYRPSHADFTYDKKYGHRDPRGGGRASARETLARVAAGAIAQKWLAREFGMSFLAHVVRVGGVGLEADDLERPTETITRDRIEASIVRCPDPELSAKLVEVIDSAREAKDSVGGVVRGLVRNVPVGLGDPVFEKLEATLAHAMLGINAVKAFGLGLGFDAAELRGSEHNDAFEPSEERDGRTGARPASNRAGGTLGGISSGEDLDFRVGFKPTATIGQPQRTVNREGDPIELEAAGRHDPCVVPRAVPIVDAMAALVVMDHALRHRGQCGPS